MGAKACRKRTKRELKEVRGSKRFRDRLRTLFLIARCEHCGACLKFISKLPTRPDVSA